MVNDAVLQFISVQSVCNPYRQCDKLLGDLSYREINRNLKKPFQTVVVLSI